MPHISLAMQNNGDTSVCNICRTNLEIDGQPSTIDKHSINKFWNSPTRQKIIDDLDNGIKHSGCNACWDLEASGNISSRQNFNKIFAELLPLENPQVLIIKPGNTCNSACRTCIPETSSSLYSDYYKLYSEKNPNVKFKNYIQRFENIRNSFAEDNPNFWPVINSWYYHLNYMDVYGGEPWLVRGLWKSLQHAIDTDCAKNIELQFHTNAMTWNEDYLKLLTNFKSVRIGLSIDSHLESEFNYLRHKSDYKTVITNSKNFINFINQNSNMSVYISVTTSILNIWNLPQIVNGLSQEFNVEVGYTNYVHDPKHYDIRHLPLEIKKLIITKFSNSKFEKVSNFMNTPVTGCEFYWPKFCMETDKFDRIRDQKFSLTFPEWYAILKPYWNYKQRHPEWYGTV
jgi:hypothetical protein